MQPSVIQHVYTLGELHEEAQILRRTFSLVRLVSPGDCRAFSIERDGLVQAGTCHGVWGRSQPCEYCLSRHVLATRATGMKTEMLDGRPFLVLAKFILLDGREYSLEMVSEVTGLSGFEREARVLEELSRLQRENSRLMRDSLTGCYSRHYLNGNFHHYAREAAVCGRELCVALFDMDNFKDINDGWGHATGDEVLKSCCRFWLGHFDVPGRSFLTRYGGDEFVITSMEDSYEAFCSRVVRLASSMPRSIELGEGSIPFAFTMGCACRSEVFVDNEYAVWDALFPLVDARMYRGKTAGRNRIVTGRENPAGA